MGFFQNLFEKTFGKSETAGFVSDDTIAPLPRYNTPLPRVVLSRPAELGDYVRDIVTGFEGVVISYGYHLHGCNRLSVENSHLKEDGTPGDAYTFDIMRLEVYEPKVLPMPMSHPELTVGAKVRDTVTKYEGIISAIEVQLSGDMLVAIEEGKLMKDGSVRTKPPYLFAGRLELLEPKEPPVAAGAKDMPGRGGPTSATKRASFER